MQRWLRNREIGSKRKLHLGTRFKHFQLLLTSHESESKRSITYSNDSQWLIGAWGFDSNVEVNTVSIWDSNQYSPRNDIRLNNGMVLVHSVASHHDLVAIGGQCSMMDDAGEVKIVSMHKMEQIESHKFPLWVYAVEFFEPTILATACMIGDTANAIAQLRDMRCRDGGILIAESEENRGIRTLNCHPTNSNLIAIGGDDVGAIFDIRKPLIPAVELFDESGDSGYLHTIRWSPSGRYLAASGMYGIGIWNCHVTRGSVTRDKEYHAAQLDDLTFFNQCLWMDDEENILSGDTDGVIHVWNRKTDEKMMLKSYSRDGYPDDFQLSYNRIHRQLATGYQDQIGIWSHFKIKSKPDIISYQMITREILDNPDEVIPLAALQLDQSGSSEDDFSI